MLRSLVGSEMCIRDRKNNCEKNGDNFAKSVREIMLLSDDQITEKAAKQLKLSREEKKLLFYPQTENYSFSEMENEDRIITKKHAINCLYYFSETGVIDWYESRPKSQ